MPRTLGRMATRDGGHSGGPVGADQQTGLTDMDPDGFRAAGHAVVDLMADYLAGVERFPVFPSIEPGSLAPLFPPYPPESPEPLAVDPAMTTSA